MEKHNGKSYDPIQQKKGEGWKDFLKRFKDHLDESSEEFTYQEAMSIAGKHYEKGEEDSENTDSGNDSEEPDPSDTDDQGTDEEDSQEPEEEDEEGSEDPEEVEDQEEGSEEDDQEVLAQAIAYSSEDVQKELAYNLRL